eukprot:scaffold93221_cov37-Phaeocystis_antarctica.AAC.1
MPKGAPGMPLAARPPPCWGDLGSFIPPKITPARQPGCQRHARVTSIPGRSKKHSLEFFCDSPIRGTMVYLH